MSKRSDKRAGNMYTGKAFGGGSAVRRRIIKIIIIFIVGLATFVVAAIIFLYVLPRLESDTDQQTDTTDAAAVAAEEAAVAKTTTINNEAYGIVDSQGYSAVGPWFEEKVDKATDPYEKSSLYIQWSQTATNNRQLADALTYALKAEDIEKSGFTSSLVANAAYELNDRAVALKYYKLTLERMTDWIGNEDVRETYEQRIAELDQ